MQLCCVTVCTSTNHSEQVLVLRDYSYSFPAKCSDDSQKSSSHACFSSQQLKVEPRNGEACTYINENWLLQVLCVSSVNCIVSI